MGNKDSKEAGSSNFNFGKKPTTPTAASASSASAASASSANPATAATASKPTHKHVESMGGIPSSLNPSAFGATISQKLTVNDFELLTVVGKGSFGKVMQVRKKDTNKIYAMKVLKKQNLVARKQVAHTITERRVLEEIDHPFIVSLRYAFQTDDKLYMILDYFTGGELFFHLKNEGKFSEDRARLYAAEIACALDCLHNNNIIYRDLKPENILLDDEGHIRLTDFGLSKESIQDGTLAHTFCGTPEYLAPEVLQGQGHGKAVDWWSLGTLLFEMLTGLPPFYNQNVNIMYEKILRAKLTFPAYLSPEAKSLLAGLIERDVSKRLGSGPTGTAEIKNHPFFAKIDWEKLWRKEYDPPFKPNVSSEADVSNVDDEFKKEAPKDTPVQGSQLGSVANQSKMAFPGFTYIPDDNALGRD